MDPIRTYLRSDFDPGRRIISNGNATLNGVNSLKLELVSL
jgi:hypothetical protein